MAIGTNDTIEKFGAQDTVQVASPASISDGAFSLSTDVNIWINTDDAPFGYFVLELTAAGLTGGSPQTGGTIDLFTRMLNVAGSPNHAFTPEAGFEHYYLGTFPIENSDTDQRIVIGPIRIPNVMSNQQHQFYLKNNIGGSVATGDTWQLFITPVTFGPAA